MNIKKGDRVLVESYEIADYNLRRRKKTRREGQFVGNYSYYIQIIDKYKIRRSIDKRDIVRIIKLQQDSTINNNDK